MISGIVVSASDVLLTSSSLVRSEVLTYVQFSFGGRVLKNNIVLVLSSFFTEDELVAAKTTLFTLGNLFAGKHKDLKLIDYKGAEMRSKQTLDAEDIVKLSSILDVGKFVASPPTSVVEALDHIPPSFG